MASLQVALFELELAGRVARMPGAKEQGVEIDYDQAREAVYGMPFNEWKDHHQLAATPEQKAAFAARQALQT